MSKKKVFKKKLENFIKDESGDISREKVLKIGLGTVSALGIMAAFTSDAISQTTHSNSIPPPSSGGPACVIQHNNHSSHASHSSY